uniref:SWIM-type domain-containing protein n=1 Tax=Heliothis virescens TaxID=7102 RepID=A0A2A4J551_HELVI
MSAFKIFRQNYFNRASKHVMIDFSVAAALINKFHTKIRDRDDAAQILEIVNQNMEINNDLSEYVRERNLNRARADFRNINVDSENVREFPVLSYSDLILIACGTYQLKQAPSYYGEHIRFNGCYQIELCNDHRGSIMEGVNVSPNCFLLRARIAGRHISRKVYFVYILINSNDSGRSAIKKYCCNCIVGRRTVGCCAHVMTVIWYLGWARYQTNIFPPAQFLDDVLIVYDTNDMNV